MMGTIRGSVQECNLVGAVLSGLYLILIPTGSERLAADCNSAASAEADFNKNDEGKSCSGRNNEC